jgi:hypothetical protein
LNAAFFCFTSLFIGLPGKNDSLLSYLVFKLAAVPAASEWVERLSGLVCCGIAYGWANLDRLVLTGY